MFLTFYAIFDLKMTEGNVFSFLFGGVVPFILIGNVIYLLVCLWAVKFYTGSLRIQLLSIICVITAVDFANDLAAVFFKIQLVPI